MKLQTRKKLFFILFPVISVLMIGVAYYMKDSSQDTRSSASVNTFGTEYFDSYLPEVISVHPTKAIVGDVFDYKMIVVDQDTDIENVSILIIEGPSWLSLTQKNRLGGTVQVESGNVEKIVLEISDGENKVEEVFYLLIEDVDNVE
jgi:hypothetical protein